MGTESSKGLVRLGSLSVSGLLGRKWEVYMLCCWCQKSYFNKCLILKMSVLCVDIFYEISAQLRHLVWCQLPLVYVVWATRVQTGSSSSLVTPGASIITGETRERKYQICLLCVQWPVTRCAKLRVITINNNQLNVTISITVIINSWWDCLWLGKQVILSP